MPLEVWKTLFEVEENNSYRYQKVYENYFLQIV